MSEPLTGWERPSREAEASAAYWHGECAAAEAEARAQRLRAERLRVVVRRVSEWDMLSPGSVTPIADAPYFLAMTRAALAADDDARGGAG